MREEIPLRAFINAQIIREAEKGNDWQAAIRAICEKYASQGLAEYQFMNPAYVVSLLYCLLVVPKELWIGINNDHPVFEDIKKDSVAVNVISKFKITTAIPTRREKEWSDNLYLLHKLRNSIAHANYDIGVVDGRMNFKFLDNNFECSIGKDDLMTFLSVVGAKLAMLRSAP